MASKVEGHWRFYHITFIVIMVGVIIFLSGCMEIKDNTEKSYQNLKVGETAVLSYDNTKLAVTVKSAKIIQEPVQNEKYVTYDIDYEPAVDGVIRKGENLIGVKLEIKNIGNSGSKTPSNLKWYAKGVDYAGFDYNTRYGGIEPWGMYPGDIREGTIKIYSVPDKALKGLKFVYACGEEASWVIFP